jgi:TetR/AcrR family transcriptional regulator, transcriptional repressor for nem operon
MYDGIDPADGAGAAKLLAGYLSLQHVRRPAQGCPLPSLTPEIARADEATQAAYQAGLVEIHSKVQRLTATSDDAWTLMAQNIGAVMLARALSNEVVQRDILAAVRRAGEKLLADRPDHAPSVGN